MKANTFFRTVLSLVSSLFAGIALVQMRGIRHLI